MSTEIPPQPWDTDEVDLNQDSYMANAKVQEAAGKRLVVQTYVNAYQDDEGEWWLDYVWLTDYRNGEQVLGYDPNAEQPDLSGFCVVKNEIKWTD